LLLVFMLYLALAAALAANLDFLVGLELMLLAAQMHLAFWVLQSGEFQLLEGLLDYYYQAVEAAEECLEPVEMLELLETLETVELDLLVELMAAAAEGEALAELELET
jgi:hypothetical protein